MTKYKCDKGLHLSHRQAVVPPPMCNFLTDILLWTVLSVVPVQMISIDISLRRRKPHATGIALDSSIQFGDDTVMSPVRWNESIYKQIFGFFVFSCSKIKVTYASITLVYKIKSVTDVHTVSCHPKQSQSYLGRRHHPLVPPLPLLQPHMKMDLLR